jgi:hypothetical protein
MSPTINKIPIRMTALPAAVLSKIDQLPHHTHPLDSKVAVRMSVRQDQFTREKVVVLLAHGDDPPGNPHARNVYGVRVAADGTWIPCDFYVFGIVYEGRAAIGAVNVGKNPEDQFNTDIGAGEEPTLRLLVLERADLVLPTIDPLTGGPTWRVVEALN